MIEVITYGEGGADDTKPDGNVVERRWVELDDELAAPSEPVTIAADDLAALQTQLAKATTVNGLKGVLTSFFDALT